MGDLYLELKKTIVELEQKLSQVDEFLNDAPRGYLSCHKYGNAVRYYHNEIRKNGKRIRKGIRISEMSYIKKLATKRYYTDLQPEIVKELNACRYLLTNMERCGMETAFSKMNSYRKNIVDPLFADPDDTEAIWKKITFQPKEMQPDVNVIRTRNGEYVRSKSEKIIADELQSRGIPYKYECPIKLRGFDSCIYPDFTVLNKRTGKEYYWEHLGKMDDVDYYGNVQWRLDLYARNKIFIGDKLLLTYETGYHSISVPVIEYTIENYLI